MTRFTMLWGKARSSLWLVPALLTALAVGLASTTIWIDRQQLRGVNGLWFVFAAGAEGARGVLSTIAGSIITVTGVVFSVTIVVLQLASSQFTPRVLRSFTEDRGNQLVLGVFIGTFTYSLLVLRTVRSTMEDYDRFVPSLSVTVALVLALVSIGFLIYFISHIARSIQAEIIIERVTHDALEVVNHLFPESLGDPASGSTAGSEVTLSAADATAVRARGSGYLQAVDENRIMHLAEEHDLVLRMEKRIGDFVVDCDPLLLVWPDRVATELVERLRDTMQLGAERTRDQDVERGLIELTDIGVRALSPGTNDPTTSLVCIDRLGQILAVLGTRRWAERARVGSGGRLRFVARRTTFDDIVGLTYGQFRHYGAANPAVAIRLATSLRNLMGRVSADHRHPLHAELTQLLETARREVKSRADLQRIEDAARDARPAESGVAR